MDLTLGELIRRAGLSLCDSDEQAIKKLLYVLKKNPAYEAQVRSILAHELEIREARPKPRPAKPSGFFAGIKWELTVGLENRMDAWVDLLARALEALKPKVESGTASAELGIKTSAVPADAACASAPAELITVFERLAAISKPGAVMDLWSDVEKAVNVYADTQHWRRARLYVYIGWIKRQRLVTLQEVKCLQGLQEIRNIAAHDRIERVCYAVIARLSTAIEDSR